MQKYDLRQLLIRQHFAFIANLNAVLSVPYIVSDFINLSKGKLDTIYGAPGTG